MSDLADTFGAEFAEDVKETIAQKRAEREKIPEEVMNRICHLAVNEDKFKEGGSEPQFTYTSDSGTTHNVLLVQVPDPQNGSVWEQVRKLDSGAVSMPLEYMGEWIWSIFNDESMAKTLDPGEWYIAAGNLSTWEPEDGSGERDQFSPVRGIIHHEQAKEIADQVLEEEGFSTSDDEGQEEPEFADEGDDEDTDDDDGSSSFSSGDDDSSSSSGASGGLGALAGDDGEEEEEDEKDLPSYSEVAEVVEALAEEEPEVWEATPDNEHFETLIQVICDEGDWDFDDEDVRSEVIDITLDRVEEGPSDEEEEDEEEEKMFG